jgi:hypothetical protein
MVYLAVLEVALDMTPPEGRELQTKVMRAVTVEEEALIMVLAVVVVLVQ